MTNIMPVESFRDFYGMHPFHSWQLSNATYPASSDCDDIVYQYGWQANDSMGRKDIRVAIDTAENRLREFLGYSVAPHYVVETLPVERFFDSKLNRLTYTGADGRWLALKLGEGKVIKVGVETRTLIGAVTTAGGSLVFSDADGDGINDTFTATIATTVTDVTQIEVMFVAADRMSKPAGDDWTIKPVTVTLSGGNAIIVGRMWQIVRPALYESAITRDPSTVANFAASLEVYRHYCDPTGTTVDTAQAKLIWETRPYPGWASCFGCGSPNILTQDTDPATVAYAIARVGIRDAENGLVSIGEAVYDTTQAIWGSVSMSNARPPDRIEIRYLAGDTPDAMGGMSQKWIEIVSRFAAAELNKRVCACVGANRAVYNQQIDRAFGGDARVEKFMMSQNDQNCPFGTREGQISSWRSVRNLRQIPGVIA
jgi:hypothetical protein